MQNILYQSLTCPMYNCPNDNKLMDFTHVEYDDPQMHLAQWKNRMSNTAAYNCKIVIKADRKLNGKLTIDIQKTTG